MTANPILSCFDARTGQPHYEAQRLDGLTGMYASPVGAANRIHLASRDGKCSVLRHGPKLEILALNSLDDRFDASPAVVDNDLLLRGHQYLYCVATGR